MTKEATIHTSETLGAMQPSLTLGITAKAKAMKAQGIDVVSLCAGEPDFDTPDHIKEAAIKSLKDGFTKYTPASGMMELREAVAKKLTEENGIKCDAPQVIVAPGAKFSVFSAVQALCNPGDEVIIPTPAWLSYPEMVNGAGAKCVFVKASVENGFCVKPEQLEQVITKKTKLLILNTPSNPTGGVYDRDTLEAIGKLAVKHNFMVLADEIYEELVYDPDKKHVSLASISDEIAEHAITVNGFSKAWAMTGWRLGYLAAPLWLSKKIGALQSHSTSNPTSFAQVGALAALQGPKDAVVNMREAFSKRLDRIHELLKAIPGISVAKPAGAFYIFPGIESFGIGSMDFAEKLLTEKNMAIIPGKPFMADENIRLSYACSMETIEEACARLADFCKTLR